MEPLSLGTDAAAQPGSMDKVIDTIKARDLWKKGITGKGVGIALIDTGVAPVPSLVADTKVTLGPDLSIESQLTELLHLDTYGHGTHMAGIMAGREGPEATGAEYAADTANFHGVAPDAQVLSLKVANHAGATDVSQVIAAIDWVVQYRYSTGMNIRVINLSYGTASQQDPLFDPLAYAAEIAMQRGLVVVTAAGNNAASETGLIDPAYHPNVIAVGATDMKGTADVTDDTLADFSARAGGNAAPTRGPDIVAPGTSIVSLRVPGSTVAVAHSSAAVGEWGIKGSGTSQAAAVVSGAVALMLQRRPAMLPPQVKELLTKTAKPLTDQTPATQGSGVIDLAAAASAPYPNYPAQVQGKGTGTIEAARAGIHLVADGVELTGEKDLLGGTWDPVWMSSFTQGEITWGESGSTWNSKLWTGSGWMGEDDSEWDARKWYARKWKASLWAGATWSGGPWTDASWTTKQWTETGWSAGGWSSDVQLNGLASSIWATSHWG
ncbi:MAG: S8 family serine peptidase [Actinomycetales bacterium]|nr:S8 family serine peptidase [Actinomycetales bacterium]